MKRFEEASENYIYFFKVRKSRWEQNEGKKD